MNYFTALMFSFLPKYRKQCFFSKFTRVEMKESRRLYLVKKIKSTRKETEMLFLEFPE